MERLRPVHRGISRNWKRDRGSQFVEFGVYLPLLILVFALAMETFATFLALERMENAARTGARVAADEGTAMGQQAARESLPSWLGDATVTVGTNSRNGLYTEVQAELPFIFSVESTNLNLPLSQRVDMPNL